MDVGHLKVEHVLIISREFKANSCSCLLYLNIDTIKHTSKSFIRS